MKSTELISFTPHEQRLFHAQKGATLTLVPSDIVEDAKRRVNERNSDFSSQVVAFARARTPVLSLSFDEWRERVGRGSVHGTPGKIEYSYDGGKVCCPLCGGYMKEISNTHLRRHGLETTDHLRELMGLNNGQSLASPVNVEKRSVRNIKLNTVQALKPHTDRVKFKSGQDPRREGKARLQEKLGRREKILEKRDKNLPPANSAKISSHTRLTHRGSIKVYGHYYFISNKTNRVEIEITDGEIIASGEMQDGTSFEKRFTRKDR